MRIIKNAVINLIFTAVCLSGSGASAQTISLPIPAGEYDVFIRYFSLKRSASVPKGVLVPLRASGIEDCRAGEAAKYYEQLPVIEISPGADASSGKPARFFPGVFPESVLRAWRLPQQALPSVQSLEVPRAYDLPGPAQLRGTILFLPGLGSEPQFYLTIATALATRGYKVLISAHPGISGDAYTSGDCMAPGIDQAQLMIKIQKAKLIDPVMDASLKVLVKDIAVLAKYARNADTEKRALPLFVMGHSIGGIAANMYCSKKGNGCAAAVNLDGGEYPLFPRQSWPSRRDLPYLKFHSTENMGRDRIPKELPGPRQCLIDFSGGGGKVRHESFTDTGFFKGIPPEDMPLADLRSSTARAILSFLSKTSANDRTEASLSWCDGLGEQ